MRLSCSTAQKCHAQPQPTSSGLLQCFLWFPQDPPNSPLTPCTTAVLLRMERGVRGGVLMHFLLAYNRHESLKHLYHETTLQSPEVPQT